MFLTIVVFILTLLLLVVTHEFGHFTAAKKFGVKVLEFGFGIPPRIWGKKIGETLVSINLLPIGGFVRLFGEDETDKQSLRSGDLKKAFFAQPVWERIGIVVAGVLMNFLLAAILFWIVLGVQGFKTDVPLLTNYHFIGANQTNETSVVLGNIAKGSPAESAGIKNNDRVIKINGADIQNSGQFIALTKESAGQKITLTLADPEGNNRTVELTPRVNPPAGQGPLGVQLADFTVAHLNFSTLGQKFASGITYSYNLAVYQVKIFADLISISLKSHTAEPVSQSVAGPVGLANLTGSILQTSAPLIPYLNFVALLSLTLGTVNILPFPALDGGRLLFLLIEAVSRRRVNPEVEKWVHTAGFAVLLALFILITFSDIRKLVMP